MWNRDPKLTRPVVQRKKGTTSDLKTERIQNEKDTHQSITEAPQEEETGNEGEGEDKFALAKLHWEGQEERVSRASTLEKERFPSPACSPWHLVWHRQPRRSSLSSRVETSCWWVTCG